MPGDPQIVIDEGISVKGRTVAETQVRPGTWEEHVAEWPEREPAEKV